jgi:hypothetical protein
MIRTKNISFSYTEYEKAEELDSDDLKLVDAAREATFFLCNSTERISRLIFADNQLEPGSMYIFNIQIRISG